MKAILILCAWLSIALAWHYELHPVKVSEGVVCFFGKNEVPTPSNGGAISNSCYIDVGDYWVVFDPGPTALFAKEAYAKVAGDKPVKIVLNSHGHDDHTLGNAFFTKSTIIGAEGIEAFMEPRLLKWLNKEQLQGSFLKIPDLLLSKKAKIASKKRIELYVVEAHTKADLIAYMPEQKILFAGDIIFTERLPSIRDGNLQKWIAVLEWIKKLHPRIIVPGHGKKYGAKAYAMTLGYLKDLKAKVAKALEDGIEYDEVTKVVDMSRYKNLALYKMLNNLNILEVYQQLEMEIE
ncbi:MBL fold metallo-hydrolase [Nitratiruptor tergarcus]|uniref:Glyoxylase, beta-lactamase superfamily II n=1 Tax=Nitratiruptor tergarcus DSM 16512 TaxID=1069081 RepID=A0A1W1WR06_9BACT|nr:MBL fold metallo-hydrolase [Nitratiruptor tergarcus]SMC08642.1 Glyoxylase, beta-lactamase superfamily II [Nitratiruptor tergarcus DSM 16512]